MILSPDFPGLGSPTLFKGTSDSLATVSLSVFSSITIIADTGFYRPVLISTLT